MKGQGIDTSVLFNKPPEPAVQVLDPQKIADQEAAARAKAEDTPPPEEDKSLEPQFFQEPAASAPDKETATPQSDADTTTDTPDAEDDAVIDASGENFKKLRGVYKETKKSLKALELKNKEYEAKLKSYVPPEALQEKEARIAELSKYEKLHSLKTSKEYQDQYIKPLNQEQTKLKEILKDYGVPEEALNQVVKEAVSLTNHADLNSFLSEHFSDTIGANEAKGLITNIRNIENQARSAEAEPSKALESLQESNQAVMQQREVERRGRVASTAKSAWEEVMLEIRKEGQVKELIPVDDDPDFNENFAYKLQRQAAAEYGKVITEMAKDGATPSKTVAKALAKMTALSQVAGVSIHTRNRAMAHAEEVIKNAERESGFYRPNVGGGSGSNAPADQGMPTQRPISPDEQLKADVKGMLNGILSKR